MSPRVPRWAAPVAMLSALVVVGAVLLIFVYRWAQTAPPDYNLFWLGMACMFIPLWLFVVSPSPAKWSAPVAISVIGLCAFFPAFLRAPSRPVFGDALAHYLSVENTLRTGKLFASNPSLPIASYFPGLHTLTASLVRLSGASIWNVAVVLLALCHVSTLLGIYTITLVLSKDRRASAVAASIYSVSPQYSFFDSQFAYESLAVPFLVWTIAAVLCALDTDERHRSRFVLAVSVMLGACCIITHHLTSYILSGVLILLGVCELVMRQGHRALTALGTGLLLALLAVVWVLVTKAPVIAHLEYFPRTAVGAVGPIVRQILGIASSTSSARGSAGSAATATRSLFSGSTLPMYERYAAFLAQLVAFAATGTAAWRLRHYRSGAIVALLILAATYFLFLPLRLNLAALQGVGRVSTFQWIAIAAVIPLGLLTGSGRRRPVGHRRLRVSINTFWSRRTGMAIVASLLFICLVGNYGEAVDASTEFPGAFQLGSTAGRDSPLEAVHLAQRFLVAEGPNRRVVSDGATSRIFETYAYTQGLGYFPQWEFFMADQYTSEQLQSLAYDGHINAIVIDDRVVDEDGDSALLELPVNVDTPITAADLHRLEGFSWLRVMFRTTHYTVLKVVR